MSSFSHLLSNLFIGLCKGSPILRPYSNAFEHDLNYGIFRFEASFQLATGDRVNPDLVVISNGVECTLVLEWTEASVVRSKKERQLERYSRISKTDLTGSLAVPPRATTYHNVVLILDPSSTIPFKELLRDRGWSFPMLEFAEQNPGYSLKNVEHDFDESKTDTFFKGGLQLERIPLRYLQFSLEDISHSSLVAFVVSHLTSLIVRGSREVTVEEFCIGYVRVWEQISLAKRTEIRDNTRQLLSELSRDRVGQLLLRKAGENPSRWLLDYNSDFRTRKKYYRNSLDRFIARKEGRGYQPELPFE